MGASWLWLAVGGVVLIFGSGLVARGVESLTQRTQRPLTALLLLGLSMCLPELAVVLTLQVGEDAASMGAALMIGSSLTNLLLVVGIGSLVRPLRAARPWDSVGWGSLLLLVPVGLFGLLFLVPMRELMTPRSWWVGVVLIVAFVAWLALRYQSQRPLREAYEAAKKEHEAKEGAVEEVAPLPAVWKILLLLIGGFILLGGGAWLCADWGVSYARKYSASYEFVGILSLGFLCALPELVTVLLFARTKPSPAMLDSIAASTVGNLLWVAGINALLGTLTPYMHLGVDWMLLCGGSLLILLAAWRGKPHRVDRLEAGFLLAAYIGFIVYVYMRQPLAALLAF